MALTCTLGPGCSPALDWRQVTPAGLGVSLSFPCRPASQERDVDLGGRRVALVLHACTANDSTFALAAADMRDVRAVAPALDELTTAAVRNLAAHVDADQPYTVPGMTPHVQARRLRLSGRLPDGKAVIEHTAVAARGSRVFQFTVVGAQPPAQAVTTFLDSTRLTP